MPTRRSWTAALLLAFASGSLLLPGCGSSSEVSEAAPVNPEVARSEGAARAAYAKEEKKSASARPRSTAGTRR